MEKNKETLEAIVEAGETITYYKEEDAVRLKKGKSIEATISGGAKRLILLKHFLEDGMTKSEIVHKYAAEAE